MNKKKATMKDIAKEANVSLATVSYVLNKVQNQKISNDTREKILHIADELNYVPNYTAKILAKKKSCLIGIIINKKHSSFNKFIYYDFANKLQQILADKGYDVVIASTNNILHDVNIISKRELEAVYIIDIDESEFMEISNNCIVPIILIDSIVTDEMFYSILPNITQAVSKAKQQLKQVDYIIIDQYNNKFFMNNIKSLCYNLYIYSDDDIELKNFLDKHKEDKGVIIGDMLASKVLRFINSDNVVSICFCDEGFFLFNKDKKVLISNQEKADKAASLMEQLLVRNFSEKNKNIYINC